MSKRAFAKSVGKALEARLGEGRFERLVVVAPPPALGDLRQALPKIRDRRPLDVFA